MKGFLPVLVVLGVDGLEALAGVAALVSGLLEAEAALGSEAEILVFLELLLESERFPAGSCALMRVILATDAPLSIKKA